MEMKRVCTICKVEKDITRYATPKNNICQLCANIRNRTFMGLADSQLSPMEIQQTKDILEGLGYFLDSDKTIHQQWLDRHPELKK
jgi:hypothetical protein